MVTVEFQLLDFEVDAAVFSFDTREGSYTDVYCYASLAGGDVEQYYFTPSGERRWESDELASRTVLVPAGEDLELQADCTALTVFSPLPLGSYQHRHSPADWEAEREFTVRSEGGRGWLADPTTVSRQGSVHRTVSVPRGSARWTTIWPSCNDWIDSA